MQTTPCRRQCRTALWGALAAMLVALPLTTANARWLEKASPFMPYGVYIEGLQGSVVLSLMLDQNGRVTGTRVLKTSGSPQLDELALEAAMKWRLSRDSVVATDFTQGRVEKIVFLHKPPHAKALPLDQKPYWAAN